VNEYQSAPLPLSYGGKGAVLAERAMIPVHAEGGAR